MNRVTVAAALATAATATMAVAATVGPAMAAARPAAAHPAAHVKTSTTVPRAAVPHTTGTNFLPTQTASEFDHGKYVTVVHCVGVDSPPPVHLGTGGVPLTVSGEGPSSAVFKMLKEADPYKTIYTCTVNVEEKTPAKPALAVSKKVAEHWAGCGLTAGGTGGSGSGTGWTRGAHGKNGKPCTKKVTLNTGFGGLARQVAHHHPAG
jgi:hypothetical protein